MSYPVVYPYQTGTAFTDSSGGRSSGDWQAQIMTPVTEATVTANQNKLGVVDGEGRVVSAYASQARTATPTAYPIYTREARGLTAYVKVTAITASPSVVVTIDGYDSVSGTWYNILTSAAIVGTGTTRLTIFPGAPVTTNVSANDMLPDTIRVVMTHADADSITYSVDLDWMS